MGRRSESLPVAELASPGMAGQLVETSILCLPLGATEQHGAHLPIDTDVIVAQELTRLLVERWGEHFDLWPLPVVPLGLSHEHDWAPDTQSLSIKSFHVLLRDLAADIVRALPARNLAIVNGHGGNRGFLDNFLHELRADFAINACVIHPFDLTKAASGVTGADVHGGRSETSLMLAIAPDQVRRDAIKAFEHPPDEAAIRALIFDRGVSWPWRTDDPRLARGGLVGDPSGASAEFGAAIVESIVAESRGVFARLLENQKIMQGSGALPPG
jgi:creatinine amidohydrolase